MESELAFRFASRCNAAGKVIAIRRETRHGRPVVLPPLASRAPRLFSCIRRTYIVPKCGCLAQSLLMRLCELRGARPASIASPIAPRGPNQRALAICCEDG